MKELLKTKLEQYIKENLYHEPIMAKQAKASTSRLEKTSFRSIEALKECQNSSFNSSLSNFIEKEKDDNNFQKVLFQMIDERKLKDSDVYNKVNIDRRLFSKIRNDNTYHPRKETVLLFAFALELSEKEMDELLKSAEYHLPKNNIFNLIIRFCFQERIYDLFIVNEMLEEHNCPPLI